MKGKTQDIDMPMAKFQVVVADYHFSRTSHNGQYI
jgi:hypothetical protein